LIQTLGELYFKIGGASTGHFRRSALGFLAAFGTRRRMVHIMRSWAILRGWRFFPSTVAGFGARFVATPATIAIRIDMEAFVERRVVGDENE
jgi:hypothetical protein